MNHQSQIDKLQLSETIQMFTYATGIQIYTILKNNISESIPCKICDTCPDIHKMIASVNSSPYFTVFFCQNGYCHIAAAPSLDSSLLFVSAPIICDEQGRNVKHLDFPCIEPVKLYNLAKLFYITINPLVDYPELPYCELKKCLIDAITKGEPELATKTIDQTLEAVLEQTGLDFQKTKNLCTQVVFLIYEVIYEYAGHFLPEKNRHFHFESLSGCDTLGKLKCCFTNAGEDLKLAVFQSALLKRNTVIKQATELIEQHFHEKISQNSIANAVYLSPSYFSKMFKEVTGYNFSQYLNLVRVNKAKEILKKTNVSIDTVHKAVGFENRSYFGKIFRRLTGTTPKRYRDASTHGKKV